DASAVTPWKGGSIFQGRPVLSQEQGTAPRPHVRAAATWSGSRAVEHHPRHAQQAINIAGGEAPRSSKVRQRPEQILGLREGLLRPGEQLPQTDAEGAGERGERLHMGDTLPPLDHGEK